jgi:hypothetical protein
MACFWHLTEFSSFVFSNPVLQIVGFNPDYYIAPYSSFNTTTEGLKIEALFRKVGTYVWYKAFNTAVQPAVLLDIKHNLPAPVC